MKIHKFTSINLFYYYKKYNKESNLLLVKMCNHKACN